jgi:hypothetical protein
MVTGAAMEPQPHVNTCGDGQAKSGSARGRKSPESGRCFVSPVDRGGAMVTPGSFQALSTPVFALLEES